MKRVAAAAFCVLVTLSATALVCAKGLTTKITITGDGLQTPIEITNPEVLKNFNVWSGRGTFAGDVSPEFEGKEGFIIDWVSGAVASRPKGLRTYELSFYTKNDGRPPNGKPDPQVVYIVSYAVDPVTGQGYVYLPGKSDPRYDLNTSSILRGCEGNWFLANAAWQTAFRNVVPG
jgi:hypothetical protein